MTQKLRLDLDSVVGSEPDPPAAFRAPDPRPGNARYDPALYRRDSLFVSHGLLMGGSDGRSDRNENQIPGKQSETRALLALSWGGESAKQPGMINVRAIEKTSIIAY